MPNIVRTLPSICLFIAIGASTASAQSGRGFVGVNLGYQAATTEFDDSFTFSRDQETGTSRVTYPIDAGATFAGGGSLVNTAGSPNLRLQDGADVDVLVENQGTLIIGNGSAAQATGLEYQQDATGLWKLDLNGLALAQFDRYTLTGAAQLAGTLDIDLGYAPVAGDAFNILSAAGGGAGAFTSVLQPVGLPSGLLFKVQ